MFGFSLAELVMVILVMIIFIKPQDLPEIFHFLGKVFYRGKKTLNQIKAAIKEAEKDLGIDDLKSEINRGIAEEKAKIEEDITVIVDMYGNEHHVSNIHEIRPDITEEELKTEVQQQNERNLPSKKTEY